MSCFVKLAVWAQKVKIDWFGGWQCLIQVLLSLVSTDSFINVESSSSTSLWLRWNNWCLWFYNIVEVWIWEASLTNKLTSSGSLWLSLYISSDISLWLFPRSYDHSLIHLVIYGSGRILWLRSFTLCFYESAPILLRWPHFFHRLGLSDILNGLWIIL